MPVGFAQLTELEFANQTELDFSSILEFFEGFPATASLAQILVTIQSDEIESQNRSKDMLNPFDLLIAATNATGYSHEIKGPQNFINAEIQNYAAAALATFIVQLKDSENGEWYDFISGSDFSDEGANMMWSTETKGGNAVATCPAGSKVHIKIHVGNPWAVRFGCSLASGTGNVGIRGNA